MEVVLIKTLTLFKVEGELAGIFYTFFVGAIGAIFLLIYTICGEMV